MPKLLLLFSHKLTDEQKTDAERSLEITGFISLPLELQKCWSTVPPESEDIRKHLLPIFDWLAVQAQPGDYVLIQGDFGAVVLTVNFAFERGLRPIYSTTKRKSEEIRLSDGRVRKQNEFQHVRYRYYIK